MQIFQKLHLQSTTSFGKAFALIINIHNQRHVWIGLEKKLHFIRQWFGSFIIFSELVYMEFAFLQIHPPYAKLMSTTLLLLEYLRRLYGRGGITLRWETNNEKLLSLHRFLDRK